MDKITTGKIVASGSVDILCSEVKSIREHPGVSQEHFAQISCVGVLLRFAEVYPKHALQAL